LCVCPVTTAANNNIIDTACALLWLIGNHGWDSSLSAMHPIFFARGPAFKKNFKADPFETINMYSLLCHLLDINPRPNNGSVDDVRHILNENVNINVRLFAALSNEYALSV